MPTYATVDEVTGLGMRVIACRVREGKVPEGSVGLAFAPGETPRLINVGTRQREPKHGSLWWLSQASFTLAYAPIPQAPEAGLLLRLEVAPGHGVRHGLPAEDALELVPRWPHATLTLDQVALELVGNDALRPSPAMQEDEAKALLEAISVALRKRLGLVCTHIERIDLPLDSAADMAEETKPHELLPSAHTQEAALAAVLAEDERLQYRLFRDLPRLATLLRRKSWPEDQADCDTQVQTLRRLEHLAATTNRLPALDGFLDSRHPPEATVRLLATATRQAASTLDAAWIELETERFDLARLADHIDTMAAALTRRRTPWWTLP